MPDKLKNREVVYNLRKVGEIYSERLINALKPSESQFRKSLESRPYFRAT